MCCSVSEALQDNVNGMGNSVVHVSRTVTGLLSLSSHSRAAAAPERNLVPRQRQQRAAGDREQGPGLAGLPSVLREDVLLTLTLTLTP